jgi:hypothetical protein
MIPTLEAVIPNEVCGARISAPSHGFCAMNPSSLILETLQWRSVPLYFPIPSGSPR